MGTLWIGAETGLKRRQRSHQLLGVIRMETVLVNLRSNVDMMRLVMFISPTTYSLISIDYLTKIVMDMRALNAIMHCRTIYLNSHFHMRGSRFSIL